MFYQFMKWYLGWMSKLYFRRVYSSGFEKVPNGKPAIFASNHPAGFSEPIILGTHVSQPIHFLVLGSFMRSPWLQWFFRGLKMVPIFRRDIAGSQSIEKNKSTFEYVYNALDRKAHILIYPEAKTLFTYKVRPLKKGIVRMSMGLLKRGNEKEMYIVPVGVNFIDPSRFRSDVFVEVGDPICLADISSEENTWYNDKLGVISKAMKKLVFDVNDEARHKAVQQIVDMVHNEHRQDPEVLFKSYLRDEIHVKKIRNTVQAIDEMNPKEYADLAEKLEKYKTSLKSTNIKDILVRDTIRFKALHYLLLIIGLPAFILGAILNGFQLFGAKWVQKNMVKRIEYKAAVASAIPTVLSLVAFIVFVIFGFVLHYAFFFLAIGIPLSLYCMIYYWDILSLFLQVLRWKNLNSDAKNELKSQRKEILDVFF